MIVLQDPRPVHTATATRLLQEDIGLLSMKRMTLVAENARNRGVVSRDTRPNDHCDIDDNDAHTEIAYQALLSNDPRTIRHAETMLERTVNDREATRLARERSEEQRRRYYIGQERQRKAATA